MAKNTNIAKAIGSIELSFNLDILAEDMRYKEKGFIFSLSKGLLCARLGFMAEMIQNDKPKIEVSKMESEMGLSWFEIEALKLERIPSEEDCFNYAKKPNTTIYFVWRLDKGKYRWVPYVQDETLEKGGKINDKNFPVSFSTWICTDGKSEYSGKHLANPDIDSIKDEDHLNHSVSIFQTGKASTEGETEFDLKRFRYKYVKKEIRQYPVDDYNQARLKVGLPVVTLGDRLFNYATVTCAILFLSLVVIKTFSPGDQLPNTTNQGTQNNAYAAKLVVEEWQDLDMNKLTVPEQKAVNNLTLKEKQDLQSGKFRLQVLKKQFRSTQLTNAEK